MIEEKFIKTQEKIDERKETTHKSSKKKDILKTVGIVVSFYIVAFIINVFIPEESFRAQFILLILPTIATIIYSYQVAIKENYLTLKTIFVLLLILEALKWAERIISKIT